MTDIPDGLDGSFDGLEDAPGGNVLPVRTGLDLEKSLVILKIGDQRLGLPISAALTLGHTIQGHALKLLFAAEAPPPDPEGPGGLILP